MNTNDANTAAPAVTPAAITLQQVDDLIAWVKAELPRGNLFTATMHSYLCGVRDGLAGVDHGFVRGKLRDVMNP